jgi:hypothetical protein
METDTPLEVADEPKGENEEPQAEAAPQEDAAEPVEGEQAQNPVFKSQREKPPEGFVPHQAMHAERIKAREASAKVEALEARLAELESKANPEQPAPEYVDPLVDPEGYRAWAEHQNTATNEKLEALQQAQQQQAQQRALVARVRQYDEQYAAQNPDYADASQFLMQARTEELAQAGYSQQQIQAQLRNDVITMLQSGEAMGMNPAELAFMRAQSLGWSKKTPQPAQQEAQQQIQATAAAQEATRGVGSVTGGEQSGRLTATQLAEMSEAEFMKLSEDEIARAMGG